MIDNSTAPYAALLLRLALGALFVAHAMLKINVFTIPGTVKYFQSLGLPGFVLLPAAGLRHTFDAAAVISLIGALGVWITTSRLERRAPRRLVTAGLFALGMAVVFWLPPWDLGLLSGGAYRYAPYMRAGNFETAPSRSSPSRTRHTTCFETSPPASRRW